MKRFLATTVMAAGCTALSTLALAGPNQGANIELHILGLTAKNACTRTGTQPGCATIDYEGDVGTYYFLHVLVTDGSAAAGVAGMQFGIQYGSERLDGVGIDLFSWTLCATLEFPQPSPVWPNNGGGTLITWDSTTRCQTFEPDGAGEGVVANAGYFYMTAYSPATFRITERPVDGLAKVASCSAEEDVLDASYFGDLGRATFGAVTECFAYDPMCMIVNKTTRNGTDPCGPTPTVPSTWSTVKSLHR